MMEKIFAPLKAVIELINRYGFFKIIAAVFLLMYIGFGTYVMYNPSVIFEKYEKYIAIKHEKSNTFRIHNAPKVTNYLNQLVLETGADHAVVFEFHNGKNNPSGLQWQYADATFISDNTDDIRDGYQNVSVIKYPLAYQLCVEGSYTGTIKEIDDIDHRLALRLEIEDIESLVCVMLYDENLVGIGFIALTYKDDMPLSMAEAEKITYKYASKIAPMLDMAKVK